MADHTVHHVHRDDAAAGDSNIIAAVVLLLVVLAVAAFIVFAFGGNFRFAPANTVSPSPAMSDDVNFNLEGDLTVPTNQGSQVPTE